MVMKKCIIYNFAHSYADKCLIEILIENGDYIRHIFDCDDNMFYILSPLLRQELVIDYGSKNNGDNYLKHLYTVDGDRIF